MAYINPAIHVPEVKLGHDPEINCLINYNGKISSIYLKPLANLDQISYAASFGQWEKLHIVFEQTGLELWLPGQYTYFSGKKFSEVLFCETTRATALIFGMW